MTSKKTPRHGPPAGSKEEEPEAPATKPTFATLLRQADARVGKFHCQAEDLRQQIDKARRRAVQVPRGSDEFNQLVQLAWDLEEELRGVEQKETDAREELKNIAEAEKEHKRKLGRARTQRCRDKQARSCESTTPGSLHQPTQPTPATMATMRPVSTTQAARRGAEGPPLDGPLDKVHEEEKDDGEEEDEEEMLLRALPDASPNTRQNFSAYLQQEAADDFQNTNLGNEELREVKDQMVASRQGFLTRTASRRRMMLANVLASAQQNTLRPTDLHEALDLASPSSSPLRSEESSPRFSERSRSESPPRSTNRLGSMSPRILTDNDCVTADDIPPSNQDEEEEEEEEEEEGSAVVQPVLHHHHQQQQLLQQEEEEATLPSSSPRRTRSGAVLGGGTNFSQTKSNSKFSRRGHRKGGK